jgi:hypothetical protein
MLCAVDFAYFDPSDPKGSATNSHVTDAQPAIDVLEQ